MKNWPNVKLILALKCEESEFDAAQEKVIALVKIFIAAHPNAAKKWNQAVNARFAMESLPHCKSEIEKLALLHECGNTSALRQQCAKLGLVKSTSFDEF